MRRRARQTRSTTILDCEDTLAEVLALLPPIALGAAAGTCKMMLASVKRTVRAHPSALDRWSLAAGLCGCPPDALGDGLLELGRHALDSTSQARLVMLGSDGQLRNVKVSAIMAKLPIEAHRGEPGRDVHGEWGVAHFVGSLQHAMGSLFCLPCVLGARNGRLVRGAVTVVARLPYEGSANKRPLAGLWGRPADWFNMCGLWLFPEEGDQEGNQQANQQANQEVNQQGGLAVPGVFSAQHGHRGTQAACTTRTPENLHTCTPAHLHTYTPAHLHTRNT